MQKTIRFSVTVAVIAVLTYVAAFSRVHAQTADQPTDKDLKTIAAHCVGAQSKIRTLQKQATDSGAKRSKLYDQIDARMYVAIGKLKFGSKDTTDLEKVRTDFSDKSAKFTELNQGYIQTLGELEQLGCKEDPATFQASLTTARTQNTEIRALNTETRTFINDDIKSAISSFTAGGDDVSTDDSSDE